MSKAPKRAANAAWSKALAEGRVVRIEEIPGTLTSYPTLASRDEALEKARAAGLTPSIVVPKE